jgi:hypothetical protein
VDIAVDQLMDNIIRIYNITPTHPTSYPEFHKPKNKRDGEQSQFRRALIEFYNTGDPYIMRHSAIQMTIITGVLSPTNILQGSL